MTISDCSWGSDSLQYRLAAFFGRSVADVDVKNINAGSWSVTVTSNAVQTATFADVLAALETDSFFQKYLLVAVSLVEWTRPTSQANHSVKLDGHLVCSSSCWSL